ncbi:kinase-like domain-containing protein [Hygrophoropsis aurantiaca]|uniref:Kinase-like domain-containing protein n=1 Tax=Hygrophoropsis aurantiaca TaxID=72124 RepID=A0ACB8A3Z3_9AGAM|nr:kinase-like domain-containing protein [Hygrophoropsis aurantiaca]
MAVPAPERPANFYRLYPGLEEINYYRTGGYHPVHIGDIMHDRYRVINKLGYGGYSTVWLVKDLHLDRYAALKILAAEAPNSAAEADVLRHLKAVQASSPGIPGGEFVVRVFDEFTVDGPNGTHQCFVTEVLGPHLELQPIGTDDWRYPIDMAKRMVAQIAHGVAYLHRIGIVHGDLHLGNILMHAPAMENLSDHDVQTYFGEPRSGTPECNGRYSHLKHAPDPHVPRYVVSDDLSDELFALYFSTVHIKICDFGEAFLWHGAPQQRDLRTPTAHAAPEILFRDPVTPAVDVWSTAILAHCLLSGVYPFDPEPIGAVVHELAVKWGKLPDRWWAEWSARAEWYDDDDVYIGKVPRDLLERDMWELRITQRMEGPADEIVGLEALERRMLCYRVENRISADGVVRAISAGWLEGGEELRRQIRVYVGSVLDLRKNAFVFRPASKTAA